MKIEVVLLLKLLIGHFLGDFVFQPKEWIKSRQALKFKSPTLYVHGLIHFAITLLLLQGSYWIELLVLGVIHVIIDGLKGYLKDRIRYFFIDQALHLLAILMLWRYLSDLTADINQINLFLSTPKYLLYLIAVIILTMPTGIAIGKVASQWNISKGLQNVGTYIGIAERLIILIFILKNEYEAIGLLITAKGILRFTSAQNEEHKSEYLLVGTLLSILSAVLVGIALKYALNHSL